MDLSNFLAAAALLVSLFTFYWTTLRERKSLYLVRINSMSTRMLPEFAIINGGSADILITSIICAFEISNDKGWESPDDQQFIVGEQSFALHAGKSHHLKVQFPSKFSEDFVREGKLITNGSLELYNRDMLVIVEWIDSKGKEHKAKAKIINYGFDLNGHMRMSSPLEKWHDLYQQRS